MELMGVEPTTSSMPRKRSPTELQPHSNHRYYTINETGMQVRLLEGFGAMEYHVSRLREFREG